MTDRVRIVVTNDALYVANTGRPIDRQGVISISRQYLSTKGETPPEDSFTCADAELVQAIREKRLRLYGEELNDLKEHASQERQTRRDYTGRALWELLQNADDAMAAEGRPSMELIGAKGLGFKSVLEISERPEVHSGAFHFAFDPDKSAALLETLTPDPPRLVFRLPHAAKPDRVVRGMRSAGFATVIRLPFKDEDGRRIVEEKLRTLPPHFMLLSQHMRSFEAQFRDGSSRRLVRQGGGLQANASRVSLKVFEDGGELTEEWRLWARTWSSPTAGEKRLSAAIAIKMDGQAAAAGFEEVPLHVFYPTEESVLAPFLVHASFDLRTDRNHMLLGAHDEELLTVLGDLTKAIATYLPPSSVLELFRGLAKPPPPNVKRLDRKIQRALGVAVLETAFVPKVGGGRAKPADVHTWAHDLPSVLDHRAPKVREARLCTPALSAHFPMLRGYGAEGLGPTTYAELLKDAKCTTLEDCIRAAQVAEQACLSNPNAFGRDFSMLAQAPFWLTRNGHIRPLKSQRALIRTRPAGWPEWLAADDLDPDFARSVLGAGDAVNKAWTPLVDGRLLQSLDDLLIHCLAPALKVWSEADWNLNGWEALAAIQAWRPGLEWAKVKPYVPNLPTDPDPARTALQAVMRVPRGAEWVPASETYASHEIGGNLALADYFRSEPSRSVVGIPPKARAFGRGAWRALLRWLGVSWEPKVRRFVDSSAVGLTCGSGFWAAITETGLGWRQRDWFLDFFPQCLEEVTPQGVAKMLEALIPVTSPLGAAYLKRRDADRTHRPHPFASCVDYQLRRQAYLPCRRSLAHPQSKGVAKDLYWPETGIRGITPMLELGGLPVPQRQRLRTLFVNHLGIQEDLPDSWGPWLDWADQLADTADIEPSAVHQRVVRGFYEAFLRRRFTTPKPRSVKRIVCMTADGLAARPAAEAVWIDDPRLAAPEVQDALLAANLAIFPPMLDRGENCVVRLGVRRATQVVEVTPSYLEASARDTTRLENRLKSRRRAFAAVCEIKGEQWTDPGTIRAVHGLKLSLAVGGQVVATRATPAYREARGWLINLDAGASEALAAACADPFRHAADLRLWFTAILKATTSAEVAAILVDGGIPTYRLRDIALPDEPADDEADNPGLGAIEAGVGSDGSPATVGPVAAGDDGLLTDKDGDEDDEVDGSNATKPRAGSTKGVGLSAGANTGSRPPASPPPSGKLRKRPLYDSGRRESSERGPNAGRADAAVAAASASARGLAAEAWFARLLEATLPDGWRPQFNVRDDEVRESDVVLSSNGVDWHIEIKCLTTERIYWSQLEQQKAEAHPVRYAMAFLVPAGDGFGIYWSWNPLKELLACERRVDWVWSDTGQGPPLPKDTWTPLIGLKRPERPPNRMNFAIQVQQEFLHRLPHDDHTLAQLWAHLTRPMAPTELVTPAALPPSDDRREVGAEPKTGKVQPAAGEVA